MAEQMQAFERGAETSSSSSSAAGSARASSWTSALDLAAAFALAVVAALGFAFLGEGSALRLALTLPILFFVPGYLLIETVAGRAHGLQSRLVRGLVAIGVSPAIVGLLALSTALLPGGFRAATIVVVVTVTCFVLAGVAVWRRWAGSSSFEQTHDAEHRASA